MPLFVNEDEGLKAALSGIQVSDEKNQTRTVGVWFGMPDLEVRRATYAYLTVDMIDVNMDAQRAVRGYGPLTYLPEGVVGPVGSSAPEAETPIPLVMDYHVSTYARHPRHDRMIMGSILHRFPYQMGGITIDADNTVRRAYIMRMINRDRVDENQKRLFSKVFVFRVESELLYADLHSFLPVTHVTPTYFPV